MRTSFGKQVLGLLGFTTFGLFLFTGLFYMDKHFQAGAVSVAQAGERIHARHERVPDPDARRERQHDLLAPYGKRDRDQRRQDRGPVRVERQGAWSRS